VVRKREVRAVSVEKKKGFPEGRKKKRWNDPLVDENDTERDPFSI